MQSYEAESVALSAAVINAAEGVAPGRSQVAAATAALVGKLSMDAFTKKCAKFPLYASSVAALCADGAVDCSIEGLCGLHKSLYAQQEGAGELRTAPLERKGGAHADPRILRGSLKNVLAKLSQLQSAPQVSKADFAAVLSGYCRELIILSPFAYGNAPVRRLFLQRFCKAHGFKLSFATASKHELASAEDAAFMGDDPQPVFSLLIKCLSYGQEERKPGRGALPAPRGRNRRPEPEQIYHEKRSVTARQKPDDPEALQAEITQISAQLAALTARVDALQKKLDALKK